MIETSALYRSIISGEHRFELSLVVGDSGRLMTERGDTILFGGVAILVDAGGAASGYGMSQLVSVETNHALFPNGVPEVGGAVSGEINISMLKPAGEFPTRARLALYVRATDGTRYSEWIPQGIYFIDTRQQTKDSSGIDLLTIHGYDAMLMTEVDYPTDDSMDYPAMDIDIVRHIAESINVGIDERTVELMTAGYEFPLPVGYSSREVLKMIAAAYGGNWCMNATGDLCLVQINGMPKETRYLIDSAGFAITFGGDRILV